MTSNIISYENYDQLPKRVRESIALELTEADKMFVDKSLGILVNAGLINKPIAQLFNTAEETQHRLDAGCAIVTLLAMICDFNHIAYDGIMYYEWDEWGYGLGLDYEDLCQRCVQLGSDCPDEPWDQRWCYGNLLREISELTYEEVYQALAAGFGGKVNLFAALGRIVADYNDLDFDEEVDLEHVSENWSLAGQLAEAESGYDALAAVMDWVSNDCEPWYDRSEWSIGESDEFGLTDKQMEAMADHGCFCDADIAELKLDTDDFTETPPEISLGIRHHSPPEFLQEEMIDHELPGVYRVTPDKPLFDRHALQYEERYIVGAHRHISKPVLAEYLEVYDCTSFPCDLSCSIAGRLAITRYKFAGDSRVEGPALVLDYFPYSEIFPLSVADEAELRDKLHRRDLAAIRRLNAHYTRFYCHDCSLCYSGEHWRFIEAFTVDHRQSGRRWHQLAGVDATCPNGHHCKILD